ncbi:TetR/AcrR family transcriptional regulator [Martelella soudanensis]|uniref:TetR/AcrR family transcriptional regulator n=1 Tax=unclassified Martelella TaxID=2629616 RepID=UPI0015DF0430|nr:MULTISPECIES: TetR/AcrR family transcriptional regulator [unclassified Martelella]
MAQATAKSPWPGAEERKRGRSEKRDAVLETAVALFNEVGFHATSLDEVAARLNVTKPTIYHYFPTKDDILFECVERGLGAIRRATEAVAGEKGSGLSRLVALMEGYALTMTQDFGICVSRTSDHELSAESGRKFRALKREIDQFIRGVVAEGMADGSIAPGDPRLVTFTLTGALNGIAKWYDPKGPVPADIVAKAVVGQLVVGLAPRSRPHEKE